MNFLNNLFGKLPKLFKSEEELRTLWRRLIQFIPKDKLLRQNKGTLNFEEARVKKVLINNFFDEQKQGFGQQGFS